MSSASTASDRAGDLIPQTTGPSGYSAFVPKPLPPTPALNVDARLQDRLDRANQALGRLDGATLLLPDADTLLYTYVRKEAVLSSQIEGTQSSLSDLLLFENDAAPGVPEGDVQETANYILAMRHGLDALQSGRLPVCNRLMREVHHELLDGVRGGRSSPGHFRREQNWLGGAEPAVARFVPPPWTEVEQAMAALERFIHDDPTSTPLLIKAALSHAQFETIHPFLDGNGRVGRLLITLLLCEARVLQRPLLYLSLYFKENRDTYYDRLQRIRTHGEWEEWLDFFLSGVISVAESATRSTQRITRMVERDRAKVTQLGRSGATALRVYDVALRKVVVGAPQIQAETKLTGPPTYSAIERLEQLGILREVTGRRRDKRYAYVEYLTVLNEGTSAALPAAH